MVKSCREENNYAVWIGGGGSGGSGEYDCAHQTALYTRNRRPGSVFSGR